MSTTQCRSRIAAGAVLALVSTAASAQTPLPAIKLDNFGYRPGDAKVAIFTANPGATVQIRDAATSAVVFTVPRSGPRRASWSAARTRTTAATPSRPWARWG